MITNIAIAVGIFGIGFLTGIYTFAWIELNAYKKHPLETIALFEQYASEW